MQLFSFCNFVLLWKTKIQTIHRFIIYEDVLSFSAFNTEEPLKASFEDDLLV